MAARYSQDDLERQRNEQGERFLKQLTDMFSQTRQDMAAQFLSRPEADARFEHLEQVVERIGSAMEKLTGNVANFHENVPRLYADRAEVKQEVAELRTEIEKLKTARETDMQRGYGFQIEDIRGRYKGDAAVERGWRVNAQQQSSQMLAWVIGGGFVFFTAAVSVVLALALRKP